jgi:hypothetical protein
MAARRIANVKSAPLYFYLQRMAGMPVIALCLGTELCILVTDCNSGWQQVVHARQQLLPGKMIAGAPTPAIPKPGPQGPGFLCGRAYAVSSVPRIRVFAARAL